jgi:4-carboxymuconolactone decarboxylase
MKDYEQTLQRLALNDEKLVASMLAQRQPEIGGDSREPQTLALVRLAALMAIAGTPGSYQSAVDGAAGGRGAGRGHRRVLIAVAPMIGSARLVAAAPLLARAVGYDRAAALDRD